MKRDLSKKICDKVIAALGKLLFVAKKNMKEM
jgi:hypothetical protein